MHQLNIYIHVFAGVLALIVGIVSYTSQKGGERHALAGRIFLGLMAAVLTTAAIGVIFFRDRPFLALLTIQSFYMASSGYRATWYKQNGPGKIDFLLVLGLVGCGIAFVISLQQANILWSSAVVYYTLGALFAVGFYDVLRIAKVLDWQHAWVPEHFMKMTSAYGALFSAGMGTVLPDLGPYTQIIPAMTATVLFILVGWRYRKAFRGGIHTMQRPVSSSNF